MVEVNLRPATHRDIDELTRLDAELFGHEAWSETTWWEEFAARPKREYVVAAASSSETSDGAVAEKILGYAGLDVSGTTADVMTIAVTPRARGTGLGKRLLQHLVERSQARGAEALMLEVRADNAPAIGLYESFDFQRLTVRRRYYQPDGVDAVIMRKLLEKP